MYRSISDVYIHTNSVSLKKNTYYISLLATHFVLHRCALEWGLHIFYAFVVSTKQAGVFAPSSWVKQQVVGGWFPNPFETYANRQIGS